MSLQQIKRDLEEIKEAITTKTSLLDLSKAKAEFMAKLSEMHDNMKERGELPEYTAQEIEEIKDTVLKAFRERTEELKKDPYFQRWVRGF
ncbi:MAG: hypothetical protein ACYDEF_10755 [Methanosarcina sp.]